MISKIDICNRALAEVSAEPIGDLNEDSQEARSCKIFFDSCRDLLLEEAHWPFATRLVKLSRLSKDVEGWNAAYAYPSDCSTLQYIIPQEMVQCDVADFRDANIPYRLYGDTDDTLIVADIEDAYAVYTAKVDNVTLYPSSFVEALVLFLASKLANPIIRGREGMQINRDLKAQYEQAKNRAIANQLNQQNPRHFTSELIRAYRRDNLRDTQGNGIY